MTQYTVIYERGERNWSAYVPDLPGCVATGRARQDIENKIREAIDFHIEGLFAGGEPLPAPSIEAGTVSIGNHRYSAAKRALVGIPSHRVPSGNASPFIKSESCPSEEPAPIWVS